MNKTKLIAELVSNTFRRAVRESIVAIALMGFFAYQMQTISPGTPQYYGTILIIGSLGFIMGILWSYVIGYRTLRIHPETDSSFWSEAFLTQARLLRTVPLWYLAPVHTGVMIAALPAQGTPYSEFLTMMVACGLIFAVLTWLNRSAAHKIEEQALAFA